MTRRNLEAILLVADEPVPASVLAEIVGSRLSEVEEMLVDLAGEYARDGRVRAPGDRRGLAALHPPGRANRRGGVPQGRTAQPPHPCGLETLAVIAYRQPVTRFQVAAVRVNVDGVFRTLASRGLIQEVGTDPAPARPPATGPPRRSWSSSA